MIILYTPFTKITKRKATKQIFVKYLEYQKRRWINSILLKKKCLLL